MDFLRNWKTTIVAVIAMIMGVVSQIVPAYTELINQVQVFLLAVLAFLTKDADKTGTTAEPR